MPFLELLKESAEELGIEKLSKITKVKNILTLGITFSLLDYKVSLAEKAIRDFFAEKPGIIDINVLGFKKAYEYAKRTFDNTSRFKLEKLNPQEERLFLSGFQAVEPQDRL